MAEDANDDIDDNYDNKHCRITMYLSQESTLKKKI